MSRGGHVRPATPWRRPTWEIHSIARVEGRVFRDMTCEDIAAVLLLVTGRAMQVTEPPRVYTVAAPIYEPFTALPGDTLVIEPRQTDAARLQRSVAAPSQARLHRFVRRGLLAVAR